MKETNENLEEMHGRELLHRFSNLSQYRGVALFRNEFKQVEEAEIEMKNYEEELIKRLIFNGTLKPAKI